MPKQFSMRVEQARLKERLSLYESAQQQPAITGPVMPADDATSDRQIVRSWLTRLQLFYGVPFHYLVPDIEMLPTESIRFFQVDSNWVEALIDGAYSLGAAGVSRGISAASREGFIEDARSGLHEVRRSVLRKSPRHRDLPFLTTSKGPRPITGAVLRSAVVSGWPGLEASAFASTDISQPLSLLRLERIAPAILLVLVDGVLQRLDISMPKEALHFGVDMVPPTAPALEKYLRWAATSGDDKAGEYISKTPSRLPVRPLQQAGMLVLSVDEAAKKIIAPQVWPASYPPNQRSFTAAQFALEMTQAVQTVSFRFQKTAEEQKI